MDTIKSERLILNIIIRRKFAKITYLKEQVKQLKAKVENIYVEKEYSNKLKRIAAYEKERYEQAQSRKLKFWLKRKQIPMESKEFHYLNLTEEKLSNYQDRLLKKGPKLILDDDINLKVTIPKMEEIFEKMPKLEQNIMRGKVHLETHLASFQIYTGCRYFYVRCVTSKMIL